MSKYVYICTHLRSAAVSSQASAFVSGSPQTPHSLVEEHEAAPERGQLPREGRSTWG